ncbi:Tannase/feruloyl esterase [Truncatella angustata]|uniref:Carboxylic ester hydrolase n=1 Tax=Truncatella angustata TaxID=152316 RepID=A0A9P9A2T5_9PEZI|nr:Tannase/feruloyl esterase [Truncatella angustata]KAH6659433.1 Tannase/feruloyl esterase [Truncatella angustata]
MAKTIVASAVCDFDTFTNLTLGNIEILSFDVAVALNVSAVGGVGPSLGTDICQIAIKYTHPGQYDVVNTWIGLPHDPTNWNSRFQMVGGGGWTSGSQSTIVAPVAAGYSSSSTDGGHNATQRTADWGLVSPGNTNWPALSDFASVALDEAASLGKLATFIYYGQKPTYSYWNGCSTGGRQGHMMAQRYPSQFDGIVAGSPAINWQRFQLQQFWSDFKAHELGIAPPSCVLQAISRAATAACDKLDGVEDSVISYPGQCTFDAKTLVGQAINCTRPQGLIVMTEEMAILANAIWQGPVSADGGFQWYGINRDASLTGLLSTTCTTVDNCTVNPFQIGIDWLQIFLARNASFDTDTLTHQQWDRFYRQSVDEYTSVIGTDNPDLTDLKSAGTKLLAWHGTQDPLIPSNGTINYYERAAAFNGQDFSDHVRFFLAPGVGHCGGGPGLDPSGTVFDVLRSWVENGTIPETLPATGPAVGSSDSGEVRSIDLCLYPKVLTYNGPDPNDQASFSCG